MGTRHRPGSDLSALGANRLLSSGIICVSLLTVLTPVAARETTGLNEILRARMGGLVRESSAGRYHLTAGPATAIDQERVTRLAMALDAFEKSYLSMWRGHLRLRESERHAEIFLSVESGHLRRVMKEAGIAQPHFDTGGVYLKDSATLIVENASPLERSLLASLVHETTHFLNHEALEGDLFPPWLNEGLAQYCEFSRYDSPGGGAGFQLGVIDPGAELRVPDGEGETIYQFNAARSLSYLRGQFMRNRALSLGPLLEIHEAARYYGDGAQLRYAQSWTLVHLLADPSGVLREPFFGFVARSAREQSSSADTLPKTLGMTMDALDEAWHRHLKRIW